MKRIYLTPKQEEWVKLQNLQEIIAKNNLRLKRICSSFNLFRFDPYHQDFSLTLASGKGYKKIPQEDYDNFKQEYTAILSYPMELTRVKLSDDAKTIYITIRRTLEEIINNEREQQESNAETQGGNRTEDVQTEGLPGKTRKPRRRTRPQRGVGKHIRISPYAQTFGDEGR